MSKSTGRKVVLASRNRDKVHELQQLLDGTGFEVLSAGDFPGLPDVIEDGTTILGNATRKALLTAAYTGEIALADDTSLQIRELNGWPDIFAARFSGPGATYASNVALVLELMAKVPPEVRQARFASACVWIDPRPAPADRDLDPARLTPLAPVARRWLRNPWSGTRPFHPGSAPVADERTYWNTLVDRRAEWRGYAMRMLADQASFGGHDARRLHGIATDLLASCPDSPLHRPGAGEGGTKGHAVTLPDPRIWTAHDPAAGDLPASPYFPAGLPGDAPGLQENQVVWLELASVGRLPGRITRQPIGSAGFGYDPIFRPEGAQLTLAEMDSARKNAISHRGRALRRLLREARRLYGRQD